MKITIAHLFPDMLNLYGDTGNITALSYRMKKRGTEVDIIEYTNDDEIDFDSADIVFIGSGSDKENIAVCENLKKHAAKLKEYVESGGTMLAVCGGFQMLGKSFWADNSKIEGLGIIDIVSNHSDERLIGDIIIESDATDGTIVGFENHSGLVDIGEYEPLGKVITGFGNDGKSGFEGLIYKNLTASNLHGPLLPKNPALTDRIISSAISRRYGQAALSKLDDTIENLAHDYITARFADK